MFLRVFIFYNITKNLQILHFDPYTSVYGDRVSYYRVIMSSYRVGLTCKLCCRLFLNVGEKKTESNLNVLRTSQRHIYEH